MRTQVRFMLWQRADKINKHGAAPLSYRITVRGRRAEVSTAIRVAPADWSDVRKKVLGTTPAVRTANAALTKMLDQLTDIWADLERQGKPVTAQGIARAYRRNGSTLSLLKLLAAFVAERQTLVGIDICAATLRHQTTRFNRLKDFLQAHRLTDLRPEEFDHATADKMLYWLLQKGGYQRNSANKVLQCVFQVLRWGVRRKYIDSNPLELYKFKSTAAKDIVYLEANEVANLTCFPFDTPCLQRVRDCFIFQCWTGLAYADLAALNVANSVETAPNGQRFLRVRRAKSTMFKGFECIIPLLPEAERLLAQYGDKLPVLSNQKYNAYLKEIGKAVGLIAEKMNTHVGRKTAGTLMLNKGIPLTAVSKFLGHSNEKITQKLYAKLLDTTVLDAFTTAFGDPTPPPSTTAVAVGLEVVTGSRVVPMWKGGAVA